MAQQGAQAKWFLPSMCEQLARAAAIAARLLDLSYGRLIYPCTGSVVAKSATHGCDVAR